MLLSKVTYAESNNWLSFVSQMTNFAGNQRAESTYNKYSSFSPLATARKVIEQIQVEQETLSNLQCISFFIHDWDDKNWEKLKWDTESDAEQKKRKVEREKKKSELSRAKPQSTQPCWNDQIELSADILSIRDMRPQRSVCVCVCVCLKKKKTEHVIWSAKRCLS